MRMNQIHSIREDSKNRNVIEEEKNKKRLLQSMEAKASMSNKNLSLEKFSDNATVQSQTLNQQQIASVEAREARLADQLLSL